MKLVECIGIWHGSGSSFSKKSLRDKFEEGVGAVERESLVAKVQKFVEDPFPKLGFPSEKSVQSGFDGDREEKPNNRKTKSIEGRSKVEKSTYKSEARKGMRIFVMMVILNILNSQYGIEIKIFKPWK